MKKSEYEKLNDYQKKRVYRGHEIVQTIGIRNQIIKCRINDVQLFTAEVIEDVTDPEFDDERTRNYIIKVFWNKKVVATTCTPMGFRFAGFLALDMLRASMSAKASHRRWNAWDPEEEEAK